MSRSLLRCGRDANGGLAKPGPTYQYSRNYFTVTVTVDEVEAVSEESPL